MENDGKYHVWYCEGSKERVVGHDEYPSRSKWLWDVRRMPKIVLDRTEHEIWLEIRAA